MKRPRFKLTLEALPRPDDAGGIRRLRAALKTLLRSFDLRCVEVCEAPEQEAEKPGPNGAPKPSTASV